MSNFIEFVIVRHGETVGNLEGRLQGQSEGELNDLGLQQAAAVAVCLHDVHFNAAYSSDLKRAMDTAKIIVAAGHQNLTVTPTPGLREWHLGDLEGQYQRDLIRNYPGIMHAFLYEQGDVTVPHGESKTEFLQRIKSCLNKLARAQLTGDRVLLVTHGAAMQMILRVVVGEINRGNQIPLTANASISVVRYYPGVEGWQMVSWNQTEHLKSLEVHQTLVY